MDDSTLSALFASVADAMYKAANEVLDSAEKVLEDVSDQIDEWYDILKSGTAGGSDEDISDENKYHYLLNNSSDSWRKYYEATKNFILSDPELLDRLYQSKVAADLPDIDWWAGKTDTF